MSTPYPQVTDADFNAGITVTDPNGGVQKVANYEAAEPGPAHALAEYIRGQRPDLDVKEFQAWPLFDQGAANRFTQSGQVPAYLLTAKADGFVYDVTGQYSPTLAGPLLRYAQQFNESFFMHLFNQWYPVHQVGGAE